ncbi:MAG: AMP-binding protein, partial [Bdellovibrio sp.]
MPKQICAAFLETALNRREAPALSYRSRGIWKTLSWLDYLHWVESIAWGLRRTGIQNGSRVGIFASSSWQWSVVDFAALSLQAVTVPIFPYMGLGDLQHILRESNLDCVFVENANLLRPLRLTLESLTKKPRIWLLDSSDSEQSWQKLFEMGTEILRHSPQILRQEMREISPKSFASLHFTSGTSGLPRGVWLQHEQIWSEVRDAFSALGIRAEDRALSFLPNAHVLGRVEHLGHAFIGFHRYQAESIEKIRSHFQEVRPTILVAVPRVFEKIHSAVQTQMQSNSWLKTVSGWAFSIGAEVLQHRESHEPLPWSLAFQNEAAQTLFFQNIRQIFGGELRLAVCGGAALPEKIQRDFAASGILILEGY